MIVPSLATSSSTDSASGVHPLILDHRFGPSAVTSLMIRASSSRPRSLDELRIEHLLPSVQTLHTGATVAKVHGYAKTQNQNRQSSPPHHRASIETPYARTPSLSLILSLSLPRVHLARFQNITKKTYQSSSNFPPVHLHRLTNNLSYTPRTNACQSPPSIHARITRHAINQSRVHSIDPRARHPPSPPSRPPFGPRTSSGVHPLLALFRVGPPIFPSANARGRRRSKFRRRAIARASIHPSRRGALPRRSFRSSRAANARAVVVVAVPLTDAACDRARAGVSPALPRRPVFMIVRAAVKDGHLRLW